MMHGQNLPDYTHAMTLTDRPTSRSGLGLTIPRPTPREIEAPREILVPQQVLPATPTDIAGELSGQGLTYRERSATQSRSALSQFRPNALPSSLFSPVGQALA